jgi:hypothetical protein
MRFILGLAIAMALAACQASPVDLAAQRQDEAACRSHVAHGGSSTYEQCLAESKQATAEAMAIIAATTPRDSNADAAVAAAAAAAVAANNSAPPTFQPMPSILPPPPVRCRSVPIGNAIQTVCQ